MLNGSQTIHMIAVPLVSSQLYGSISYFVLSLKGNLQLFCGINFTCKVITCKYFTLKSKKYRVSWAQETKIRWFGKIGQFVCG